MAPLLPAENLLIPTHLEESPQSLLLYRFCFSFILFDTHVMLIVILSDVQYSQKAVFRFEKGLNGQNQSSSGPHHLVKKSPPPFL